MKLELEECDLINFKGEEIETKKYIDVLDDIFELPQVTRCLDKDLKLFKERGFKEIDERLEKGYQTKEKSSVLLSVLKIVDKKEKPDEYIDYVRSMKEEDLPIIEEIFSKEYAARFRAIKVMYNYDPKSCFVYDDELIKGVVFGEKQKNALYIHQIFVKKEFRGVGIDITMLNYLNQYARKIRKDVIRGTIRGNLFTYYRKLGVMKELQKPKSYYMVRFSLR